MLRRDKERIVAELTERLRQTETLIVADYRGLSVSEIDDLRTRLLQAGARFSVVKNTLTRLAAEAAGTKTLLEYLDGPTAIAFIQPEGDPAAVAKVLSETARTTRVLVVKGGLLEGRPVEGDDVEELAKLPPLDVLRGQVLGAVVAPLTALLGLVSAPLQDLHGLLQARIDQIAEGADSADAESASGPGKAQPVGESTATAHASVQTTTDEGETDGTSAQPEAVRPEEETKEE